jgi:ubiquitin-protein ligase E3 C
LEDSFNELWKLGPDLRKKLQVSFINAQGLEEAGIDGGGVFREYLEGLIEESFLKVRLDE